MGIEWTDGSSKPTITWDDTSRDRQVAVIALLFVCAVALAVLVLVVSDPSDSRIEGNARTPTTEASR